MPDGMSDELEKTMASLLPQIAVNAFHGQNGSTHAGRDHSRVALCAGGDDTTVDTLDARSVYASSHFKSCQVACEN